MRRPRDSQRSKVQRAESSIPRPPSFTSMDHAVNFVETIFGLKWFKKEFPKVAGVLVVKGHGRARCYLGHDSKVVLVLPGWAMNSLTIVTLLPYGLIPADVAWHGREYARAALMIMNQVAPGQAVLLEAAYVSHGVKYKLKRKRKPPTPEQLEELKKRLVVARVIRRIKRAVAS
jgi:hypothetical protein